MWVSCRVPEGSRSGLVPLPASLGLWGLLLLLLLLWVGMVGVGEKLRVLETLAGWLLPPMLSGLAASQAVPQRLVRRVWGK